MSRTVFDRRRLRQAREQAGLSQTDVAEQLDIQQSTYSRWETGDLAPPPGQLQQVAEVLGKDEAFFHAGERDRGTLLAELRLAVAVDFVNDAASFPLLRAVTNHIHRTYGISATIMANDARATRLLQTEARHRHASAVCARLVWETGSDLRTVTYDDKIRVCNQYESQLAERALERADRITRPIAFDTCPAGFFGVVVPIRARWWVPDAVAEAHPDAPELNFAFVFGMSQAHVTVKPASKLKSKEARAAALTGDLREQLPRLDLTDPGEQTAFCTHLIRAIDWREQLGTLRAGDPSAEVTAHMQKICTAFGEAFSVGQLSEHIREDLQEPRHTKEVVPFVNSLVAIRELLFDMTEAALFSWVSAHRRDTDALEAWAANVDRLMPGVVRRRARSSWWRDLSAAMGKEVNQ